MRTKRAGNPLPVYIIGGLVALAIAARILSPAAPRLLGPLGSMPNWKSSKADGTMGSWAVNPAGTMWAGAWNKANKQGKAQSTVWIIDFEKAEARSFVPKPGTPVGDLTWPNDKTISLAQSSNVVLVDADSAKVSTSSATSTPAADSLKPSVLISPDRKSYSYKAPGQTAGVPAFTDDQIAGRIEGMWASPAGILVLTRNADTFAELVFDAKTGKLNQVGKNGFTTDVKTNWPDAPKDMMFVTYRGGFDVDLATAKAKSIFSYSNLGTDEDAWRREVQEGRLYPRKDGGYASVSLNAGEIDIRLLDKNGLLDRDLLPR